MSSPTAFLRPGGPARTVTDALATRVSVRDFLPDPVPEPVLRRVLGKAARAPSGGNLQPWHVTVLTGLPLAGLIGAVAARQEQLPRGESAEYPVYPDPITEPYASRRFKIAPQFSDLGMFLQSAMLLLREEGLDSCAQESWSMFAPTIYAHLKTPGNLMLFCGVAIGKRNPAAPVNTLVSDRAALADFAQFAGF